MPTPTKVTYKDQQIAKRRVIARTVLVTNIVLNISVILILLSFTIYILFSSFGLAIFAYGPYLIAIGLPLLLDAGMLLRLSFVPFTNKTYAYFSVTRSLLMGIVAWFFYQYLVYGSTVGDNHLRKQQKQQGQLALF